MNNNMIKSKKLADFEADILRVFGLLAPGVAEMLEYMADFAGGFG